MFIVQLCTRMNICFERLRLFKIIICEQITLNRMQKPSANESAWLGVLHTIWRIHTVTFLTNANGRHLVVVAAISVSQNKCKIDQRRMELLRVGLENEVKRIRR